MISVSSLHWHPRRAKGSICFSLHKVLIPAPESLHSRNKLQLVLYLRSTNKWQLWVQELNLDLPVFRFSFSNPRCQWPSTNAYYPHGHVHRPQQHSPRETLSTSEAGKEHFQSSSAGEPTSTYTLELASSSRICWCREFCLTKACSIRRQKRMALPTSLRLWNTSVFSSAYSMISFSWWWKNSRIP